MSVAVLSLGANVGDTLAALRSVREHFADVLIAASPVFSTPPWGPVAQDDFDNAVLVVDDAATSPSEWLRRGADCERAADRRREQRWGPRTLDVDVITVDADGETVLSDDPVLTLPHPRAHQRAFVLIPWLHADPRATLHTPDGVRAVADLVDALPSADRAGVCPRDVDGWAPIVRAHR